MPFQKGESGNPTGRPTGVPDRRQLVRDMLMPEAPKLVEAAVNLHADAGNLYEEEKSEIFFEAEMNQSSKSHHFVNCLKQAGL